MNLYNGFQKIKSGIRRPFIKTVVGASAAADAELLSAMCCEARVMTARNGNEYWYYFPHNVENADVARFLLERNGVVPTFRMSRYNCFAGGRRLAFRLSSSYLAQHPKLLTFVKTIQSCYGAQRDEIIAQRLDNVRNQMRQK